MDVMQISDKYEAHSYLLKQWMEALAQGNVQRAIEVEFQHYNQLVKPGEDASLWDRWQADTLELRVAITGEFDRNFPLRSKKTLSKRFLIVHHNYSGLAHESQLARNLEFLRKNGAPLEFEIVYLFGGSTEERAAAARLYQISLAAVGFLKSESYADAGKRLDDLTTKREYGTVIYPSIFPMAYWMSLFVAHGNQKFLQMKYFPLHAGRFSAWGCGRKNTERTIEINGCEFTQLSVLNPKQTSNKFSAPANRVTANLMNTISFGSISRPEKVGDATYNRFVIEMLDQHPDVTYLYAGREQNLGHIPKAVREHSRARALGWVNPEAIISRYQIYLESFPWGGGDMTLLALENAIPYLILDTPANRVVGIYNFLDVIAQSGPELLRFSFCDSISSLAERFGELVSNAELRQSLGKAWSNAINNYQPSDVDAWLSFVES